MLPHSISFYVRRPVWLVLLRSIFQFAHCGLIAIDDRNVLALVSKRPAKILNPLEGSGLGIEPHQHWNPGDLIGVELKSDEDTPCVVLLDDLECTGLSRGVAGFDVASLQHGRGQTNRTVIYMTDSWHIIT